MQLKEVSTPGFVTSYGFGLLYEQPPKLLTHELVDRLRAETPVDVVSQSESVIQLAHPGHLVHTADADIPSLTNIVRWSKPVEPASFASALEQTWDWPQAESALDRCRYQLLVADLTGMALPYKERYGLISTVAAAVTELTHPTAIHWEPAGCLVEPRTLRSHLTWACNVRAHFIVNHKGDKLMDTMGLAAIGLRDVQCLYRGLDPSEIAKWMYLLGRQIFAKGDFIADGESIPGVDPAQQWASHHDTALIPPSRPVLDVRPPGRHAGRR